MGKLHNKQFGWLKEYIMGIIGSTATADVGISDAEVFRIEYWNVCFVSNTSTENVLLIMDGNTERAVMIPAGTLVGIEGSRFRRLQITNLDGANDTAAGEIRVTIQKDFTRLEKMELEA